MTLQSARKWLVASSLIITGCQLLFFIVCPAFGFPIAYPKNIDLLQIISPVFLGYLGSATHFIFKTKLKETTVQKPYLGMLVIGPLAIYAIVILGALFAFGYSNRVGAPLGSGMSVDDLAKALSASLGVLAVTTGIISSYLFSAEE